MITLLKSDERNFWQAVAYDPILTNEYIVFIILYTLINLYVCVYVYAMTMSFQRSCLVFILAYTVHVHDRFGIYYTHLGAGW